MEKACNEEKTSKRTSSSRPTTDHNILNTAFIADETKHRHSTHTNVHNRFSIPLPNCVSPQRKGLKEYSITYETSLFLNSVVLLDFALREIGDARRELEEVYELVKELKEKHMKFPKDELP